MKQFFTLTKITANTGQTLSGNRFAKKLLLLILPFFLLTGHSVWSQCNNPSPFGTIAAPTGGGIVTITTCAFAGEYSTVTGATAGNIYQFNATGGAGNYITIRQGTPGGTVLGFGFAPITVTCTVSGPLYLHYNTNAACGTDFACHTGTVQCMNCVAPPPGPCLNTSPFGSATINPTGTVVSISGCSFAGEYSTISGAVAGTILRFTSSVATDNITVRSGTPGGPVLAFGTTPLSFSNTFTGTVYAHWNTPGCGSQATCRATTVQCTSCLACSPITITPPAATICAGSVQPLTASHSNPPETGAAVTNSGNVNVPIVDVSTVSHTMAVSNIPVGGVITSMSVNFNITHTWDSDLIISLRAPNNQVLNLVNQRGGSGDNFTNTTISSSSTVSLSTGTPPFTGTFMADGNPALPPAGFTQTTTTFPALYGTPNGNWAFGIRDAVGGDVGTLINWSLNINYTAPILPVWAPLTELYSDPAGTIAYTGTPTATVYAAPTVTRTYSATLATGTCTPAPAFVTITTNPAPPPPTITPNPAAVCPGGIRRLDATTGVGGPGSCNTSSGAISVTVPDNNPVGISTNLTVSCVPAGATITGVAVTFNMTHTWDGDMVINLRAPNNQVLNLVNQRGGSGDNFVNTVISSASSVSLSTGTPPFTGTFMADGNAALPPTGFTQTTATFPALYTVPNGTWTLAMRDIAGGDIGILTNWSIFINYNVPPSPVAVIWAPATELFTDALAAIPYVAGTPLSTIYVRPSVARTYTAVIPSVPCPSLPAVVPVAISPNPNVVIIADPGSVLCEGDPALLTVRLGTSSPVGILFNQSGASANGSPSQVFEPANAQFTSQSADDFIVPAGSSWTVTRVTADGIGGGNPTSVNVFFYNNSAGNLPGTVLASYPNLLTYVRTGGNYNVTLPAGLVLGAGTYWVSVQVNMSFATGGQWFWGNFGTTNIGNQYAWQNPGGGFGTPCTSWGYGATGCNVGGGINRNNVFTIVGTSLADGGPLPPGYTFLWSPAAGLSSTTTNPVAASPMTTTTYTVNVTTGAGCTNQASILMTVNLRPTVTIQPVSRTNCATTSATFTVGGTGTGLTYQWQESQTGCAGPWTNLVNGGAYSGVNTATLTINPVTGLMSGYGYRAVLSGVCAPIGTANISNCALLTVNPLPVVSITPAVSCGGVAGISGTLLSVGSSVPPVPGSVTVNSGAISIPVPDNNVAGDSSKLVVSTIPANATITGVRATWTMPHTWNGDMVFVLRSPNGSILNLDYYLSATGGAGVTTGFVNTTVSSAGVNALSSGTGTYTGIFRADAATVAQPPFGPAGPTGFVPTVSTWSPMFTPIPNGTWTLAMYDGGPADLGTLTNWSITVDYTTPGGGGGPVLTYVWTPNGVGSGLYNDAAATIPYLGTNTPTVYAAPTALTVYTVTATDVATGCVNTATAVVNYTPPPPTVTPASVTMCLGDPAVRLVSSSSTTTTSTFTSGTVSVPIPEGVFPTGPYVAGVTTIPVTGIPATANISRINVRMNITHAFVGDVVAVLQAPNGQRINLDALLTATNNAGANFVNTVISSAGTTALSAGTAPWTNTFRADAVGATFVVFGFTLPGGPIGYIPTTQIWGPLTPTGASANGNWTLAMYDAGAPDIGTLTNWSIDIVHVLGVPTTRARWSPIGGLFNDSLATIPYTGDARDTVWTRPTPAGVYPYQVTVQSVAPSSSFTNPANIIINAAGPGTPYPSNLTVSGLPSSGISVDSVRLTGISHTWGDDIDILLQSPTGQNVVLMSDIGGTVAVPNATYTFRDGAPALNFTAANPTGTYRPTNNGAADTWPAPGPGAITQANPTLASFGTGNVNGVWKLFVFDDVGGDAGNISGGYTIYFNIAIPACTSPPRTVIVTVNQPTIVTTQPVNQTVCTDKVATFTVVPGGSGPFTYQWQVSTNNGNTWTNITNGGVYSGATTATLTITAPPVSMNGYFYRVVINGAAPCAAQPSFQVLLTVNPLPTVVISASPYTSLLPGLTTTLSSTVTPFAAATNGYQWLRNGIAVPGANAATLKVDIDGLGDYTLRVTDINGCTNASKPSNTVSITDSVSGKCFIYPNPSSGMFQVRYYSSFNNLSPRTLTVYDAKGDRMLTQLYPNGQPYQRMDVDMRRFGKGLYWVEIGDVSGNRLTMCRVVIQ